MNEKRKFHRKNIKLSVVINHPAFGQVIGHVRNMSEGGIFLDVYRSNLFECGQIMGVHILGDSGIDIAPLSMKVVRADLSGISLKFVEVSEEITQPLDADQYAEI